MQLLERGLWADFEKRKLISESWESEYSIPLFLVSFGLLKHFDSARNQSALLRLILGLGARII